jgi:hypothetical protein
MRSTNNVQVALLQQLSLEIETSFGDYYCTEKNSLKKALEILACVLKPA